MLRAQTDTGFTRAPLLLILVSVALTTGLGCLERDTSGRSRSALVATGDISAAGAACAEDSLRPSAAAPAQGLWLYSGAISPEQVAAMIGPTNSETGVLTVTRPVETVEIVPGGDTVRTKTSAASVTLELLPAVSDETSRTGGAGSTTSQPAATYVLSPRVRLAAYEPCATSSRTPRIRYIRRDEDGKIVTDVMLRRASGG